MNPPPTNSAPARPVCDSCRLQPVAVIYPDVDGERSKGIALCPRCANRRITTPAARYDKEAAE